MKKSEQNQRDSRDTIKQTYALWESQKKEGRVGGREREAKMNI